MVVVEGVLEAEGIAHRQLPVLGEALQGLRRLRCPPAAAGDHEGALRFEQHLAQAAQRARVAPRLHGFHARQRLRRRHRAQHVLGQHQHHGAGPPVHRGGEGTRNVLRDAAGIVDALDALGKALGAGPEEAAEVDFLEGLAVAKVAAHVADEQHHRRRILKRVVHADRRIGRARSARDEAYARPPRDARVRVGHEGGAAFLSVDDEADRIAVRMKAVEHREKAFAGHAERMRHALRDEARHEQVAGHDGRWNGCTGNDVLRVGGIGGCHACLCTRWPLIGSAQFTGAPRENAVAAIHGAVNYGRHVESRNPVVDD